MNKTSAETKVAPHGEGSSFKITFVLAVLLALSTFCIFFPLVDYEFIVLDDPDYIVLNEDIQYGFTGKSITWAFRSFHAANWHPVTWLSHILDWNMFGADAGGHHLTNVIFHIGNTILLFLFLGKTTASTWRSFFVAALFALHPLHVESVAWISERKDVLSTFFALLTLLSYSVYARRKDGPGRKTVPAYCYTLFFFALGLMSKPMLVTLPFVLLLLDVWPLGRVGSGSISKPKILRLVVEKIPFLILSAGSSVVTFVAQRAGGAVWEIENLSLQQRLMNAISSYGRYIIKTFWPSNLAFPYPLRSDIPMWEVGGAFLLLLAITWTALRHLRSRPYLAVGWFWFLGMLVPVIGLVHVGHQAMADRYTYLPHVGLFCALIWGIYDLCRNWRYAKAILGVVGGLMLVSYTAATAMQIRYWQNDITLFTHSVQVTEKNFFAQNCLGMGLSNRRRDLEAIEHYQAAVEAEPTCFDCYKNLGFSLVQLGKWEEAIAAYRAALKIRPDYLAAHANLGAILAQQGRFSEAEENFRAVVKSAPEVPEQHFNLALALKAQGKAAEAAEQFAETLRLKPDHPQARLNLGLSLAMSGRTQEAIDQFRAMLTEQPHDAELNYYYALALVSKGQPREAIPFYREAIGAQPNWPAPYNDLAWMLATLPDSSIRNGKEAVKLAERACELAQWKEPSYIGTLDAAYAESGDFKKAIDTATKAANVAELIGRKDLATLAEQRIELYRAGKPFRQIP